MGISISDVPMDATDANLDRWLILLSEPIHGHHGGGVFDRGLSIEPIDGRTFRRLVGGLGHVMVGALRVDGGHTVELGDCSRLKPKQPEVAPVLVVKERPVVAAEPEPVVAPAKDEPKEPPAAVESNGKASAGGHASSKDRGKR